MNYSDSPRVGTITWIAFNCDCDSLKKGIVGDWKNHLTEKQAFFIDFTLKDLQEKICEKYNIEL